MKTHTDTKTTITKTQKPKHTSKKLGMAAQAFNLSAQETEAEGSVEFEVGFTCPVRLPLHGMSVADSFLVRGGWELVLFLLSSGMLSDLTCTDPVPATIVYVNLNKWLFLMLSVFPF